MKRLYFIFCVVLIISFLMIFFNDNLSAQCAMCKAVAKSNIEGNANSVGAGINKGVLYLMSIPYVMAAIAIGILWRREKRMKASQE